MIPALFSKRTAASAAASGLILFGSIRYAQRAEVLPTNKQLNFLRTAMSSAETPLAAAAKVTPRRFWEKGFAHHPGFLKTAHTFAFASYQDGAHMGFSDLRVINDDRVEPKSGFPRHGHAGAEIFSYVVAGELTHHDSMGNVEILKRGDLQFTSAGTGIHHSEGNEHKTEQVHFLQIWYYPEHPNLPPQYYTLQTTDEEKTDKLQTLIRPMRTLSSEAQARKGLLPAGSAIGAQSSLVTRASILHPGKSVTHAVGHDTDVADQAGTERWLFVQVVSTSGYKTPSDKNKPLPNEASITITTGQGDTKLGEGDGAYIKGVKVGEAVKFTSDGGKPAEFLVFDLKARDKHMF